MSSLSAMDKQLLIAKINDGSFVLDDLSIDRCPKLETGDISRDVLKQVYARMVEEVFKPFHVDKEDAIICFRKCVKKLVRGRPLQATSLGEYKRSCLDEDRETWVIETEVPANSNLNIPEGGGSDFLRLYGQLTNKASLLTSSNPVEARRLRDRVDNGIRRLYAKIKSGLILIKLI